MTEAEWLAATDPLPMLEVLEGKASDRKFRLVSCGCCRLFWDELQRRRRAAVETAERFADGNTGKREIRRRSREFDDYRHTFFEALNNDRQPDQACARNAVLACACHFDPDDADAIDEACDATLAATFALAPGRRAVGDIVRDVFGNPFRPHTADPTWLTSTVVQLAEGIYQDRAFDRLPILADALQDAGCDNDDILNHCRQPGEHVRGCWVVDLILGKS
jgi:hypothetical protein